MTREIKQYLCCYFFSKKILNFYITSPIGSFSTKSTSSKFDPFSIKTFPKLKFHVTRNRANIHQSQMFRKPFSIKKWTADILILAINDLFETILLAISKWTCQQ